MQIFANLLVQQGHTLPDAETIGQTLSGLTDAADIPEDRRAALALCMQQGLIEGYADGTMHPENTITRGEYAKLLTLIAPEQ